MQSGSSNHIPAPHSWPNYPQCGSLGWNHSLLRQCSAERCGRVLDQIQDRLGFSPRSWPFQPGNHRRTRSRNLGTVPYNPAACLQQSIQHNYQPVSFPKALLVRQNILANIGVSQKHVTSCGASTAGGTHKTVRHRHEVGDRDAGRIRARNWAAHLRQTDGAGQRAARHHRHRHRRRLCRARGPQEQGCYQGDSPGIPALGER
jgi:hypothetical protein